MFLNKLQFSFVASLQAGRTSKKSFDGQFSHGLCPKPFYQLGDECLFFSIDGKVFSWQQAERVCSFRVAALLDYQLSLNTDPQTIKPTNGVRQLVLNTPGKTEILRALYREYSEQNFAVRLPLDYNTLRRCQDGKDDRWPYYCTNTHANATCLEAVSHDSDDICLQQVDCSVRHLRLACEFTLPGLFYPANF